MKTCDYCGEKVGAAKLSKHWEEEHKGVCTVCFAPLHGHLKCTHCTILIGAACSSHATDHVEPEAHYVCEVPLCSTCREEI